MKIRLLFLTIFLLSTTPLTTFARIITGANYSIDRIEIIAPNLSIRPPKVLTGEHPDFSRALSYYRKINHIIVRRNAVLDAKKALSKGQVYFLSTIGSFYGATVVKINTINKFGNPASEVWPLRIPHKLIQGAGFDYYIGGFGKRYPRENRVLDLYAQSAFRYSFYWNRTVKQYIETNRKKKKVLRKTYRKNAGKNTQPHLVSHSHGGRIHSHRLPREGVKHKHPNTAVGKIVQKYKRVIRKPHSSHSVRHSHSGRIHSHRLPTEGVKHSHGSLGIGRLTSTNHFLHTLQFI